MGQSSVRLCDENLCNFRCVIKRKMSSIAHLIFACVSLQNSWASKLHPVIATPPKEFLSDRFNNKNAFIKDALRDQKLFGYSDFHGDYRDEISDRPIKYLSYKERPSYTKIKRTYDEKLDISRRPSYSPIERKFDKNFENLENTLENVFLNDVSPVPTKSKPKLHIPKSSKTEHLQSENLKKNSKPRKKILIKRFKSKSKTKQKKNRSALEKILESLDLTPDEYLYLSEKIKTEKK